MKNAWVTSDMQGGVCGCHGCRHPATRKVGVQGLGVQPRQSTFCLSARQGRLSRAHGGKHMAGPSWPTRPIPPPAEASAWVWAERGGMLPAWLRDSQGHWPTSASFAIYEMQVVVEPRQHRLPTQGALPWAQGARPMTTSLGFSPTLQGKGCWGENPQKASESLSELPTHPPGFPSFVAGQGGSILGQPRPVAQPGGLNHKCFFSPRPGAGRLRPRGGQDGPP